MREKKVSEYDLCMKAPHQRYVAKLFPGSSHSWALSRITNWRPTERILDVGVGSGVMAIELKNRGFNAINGVEIDEETRVRAESLGCYEHVASSLDDPKVGNGFGHALLLDVLEHVANPGELLGQVSSKLCGGGSILISVPNVTHWTLRLMLLAGYFRYAERGPLDKTHLRFFSKAVLEDVVAEQKDLELGEMVGSIVPLELMLPTWLAGGKMFEFFSTLRIMLAKEFPSIFGYQLLVEVKRRA